jgi:ribonuclease Z
VIFDDKHFTLTAVPVQHRGPDCFAFVFEEKERRPFLAEKAEALGIPHGPVRRDLAQGMPGHAAGWPRSCAGVVLGEPQRGARLVFAGDVSHTGPLHARRGGRSAGRRGHLSGSGPQLAKQHGHITAAAAARLARNANVRQLVLHHVSRRYATQQVLEEAQAIFPATMVAGDLDSFSVHKDKPVTTRNLRQR